MFCFFLNSNSGALYLSPPSAKPLGGDGCAAADKQPRSWKPEISCRSWGRLWVASLGWHPPAPSPLFSRAQHHHPLPGAGAAGLLLAHRRLPGTRLRASAPQHPLVQGRRPAARPRAPGPPRPAAGPLEAVRSSPHDPPSLPAPAKNRGGRPIGLPLAGTGMFCGWRRRRAAAPVPGRCCCSSGTSARCGCWRPCCRPCLTSCCRRTSSWPSSPPASSPVSGDLPGGRFVLRRGG